MILLEELRVGVKRGKNRLGEGGVRGAQGAGMRVCLALTCSLRIVTCFLDQHFISNRKTNTKQTEWQCIVVNDEARESKLPNTDTTIWFN